MTRISEKRLYHEPQTTITEVTSEGFICQSIVIVENTVEVDNFTNNPVQALDFNTTDDFTN